MKRAFDASRRRFLSSAGALSAVGPVAAPFALNLATIGAAAAQTTVSDYRALVCVYLAGANDSFNTFLATDTTSWNAYTSVRNLLPVPIDLAPVGFTNGVLPVVPTTPQGRTYALHPEMGPLKTLFDSGRAAVLANVGPLVVPTTKAQWQARSVALPPKLFSHNDQTSMWQAFGPEGATRGWGGRLGDLFASNNSNASFTAVSATGNVVFLSGQTTRQYQISGSGALAINGATGASLYGSSTGPAALRAIAAGPRDHLIMREQAAMTDRSLNTSTALNAALVADASLPAAPTYNGAANSLAQQLRLVARMIGGRSSLGAKRQVFMVSIGGFDTHDRQIDTHGTQLGRLAQALSYFDGLMSHSAINAAGMVTAFTASEFGRTLSSNGDGTDHGWGAHHFVVGGAVRGGQLYGTYPTIGVGGPSDAGRGSLIPTTSVDQYAGILARWFGVSDTGLADLFPNLRNFGLPSSVQFMNA